MVLPNEMRFGVDAGREHHFDLGDRGGVEAGAKRRQQAQQLGRRIRLHGVENPAVRQGLGEGLVVLAHDIEIDDEAWPVVAAVAQEFADARGHWRSPHPRFNERRAAQVEVQAANRPASAGEKTSRWRAWRHDRRGGLYTRRCCLGLEREIPIRTAGKDGQASTVSTFGGPTRTKEARSVVALSRVPR